MKRTILAALAVAGLVAQPVLAGAESPPVVRLAKLLNTSSSPARAAAPAPAPVPARAPQRMTAPAPKPALVPQSPMFAGPDPVRRTLALEADLSRDIPYLHTDSWIDAQATASGGPDWQCLTQALYFEARGEQPQGLFAVAEVILNRVDSARYPDTVCDVINQGTGRKYACQFTYTCDGLPEHVKEPRAWERVGKVARVMLKDTPRVLTGGALFYHATRVSPSWSLTKALTGTIGEHRFYR